MRVFKGMILNENDTKTDLALRKQISILKFLGKVANF